jgi:CheY-like chemotaxis protein
MSGAGEFIEHGKISGEVVHVTVRDDGAGMDAATLTKIFDPFFTTKFAGRGLGLAATRGILDSHDGQLRIETALGRGSRFTFLLPIQEAVRPSSAKANITIGPRRFENREVLIVDDEESIRAILTKHLSEIGFNVHLASNGEQALAKAADIGPALSLVILDITMPGRSGIEIWSELRKTRAELPIIMSSGHPEESLDQLEGWNPAHDGFIQKPYRNRTLLEEVAALLRP